MKLKYKVFAWLVFIIFILEVPLLILFSPYKEPSITVFYISWVSLIIMFVGLITYGEEMK